MKRKYVKLEIKTVMFFSTILTSSSDKTDPFFEDPYACI